MEKDQGEGSSASTRQTVVLKREEKAETLSFRLVGDERKTTVSEDELCTRKLGVHD